MPDFKAKLHINPISADPAGWLARPSSWIQGGLLLREGEGGECCGVQEIVKIDPINDTCTDLENAFPGVADACWNFCDSAAGQQQRACVGNYAGN